MRLSEQKKDQESSYYHCSRCGCKLDDPTDSDEIIGDGIYCGEYYNNCKLTIKNAVLKRKLTLAHKEIEKFKKSTKSLVLKRKLALAQEELEKFKRFTGPLFLKGNK